MRSQTTKSKSVRERLKLGIVPLLIAALLYVLQSPDEPTPGQTETGAAVGTEGPSLAPPPAESVANAETSQKSRWPQRSLQEIIAHNPFAFPAELAPKLAPSADNPQSPSLSLSPQERETQSRQELLEQLQATKMTAYYQSERGRVAIVGANVLHEGDIIDGAVKVLKIKPDRVIYRTLGP